MGLAKAWVRHKASETGEGGLWDGLTVAGRQQIGAADEATHDRSIVWLVRAGP